MPSSFTASEFALANGHLGIAQLLLSSLPFHSSYLVYAVISGSMAMLHLVSEKIPKREMSKYIKSPNIELAIEQANTDDERYRVATQFIKDNIDNQFAKSLCEMIPSLVASLLSGMEASLNH